MAWSEFDLETLFMTPEIGLMKVRSSDWLTLILGDDAPRVLSFVTCS